VSDPTDDYARGYGDGYRDGGNREVERLSAIIAANATAHAEAIVEQRRDMHDQVMAYIDRALQQAVRHGETYAVTETIRAIRRGVAGLIDQEREESET
jgi:hypothetical protein